ncbi:MAG TPA: tetratricopeptide repeat protein [Flavipsychrobacter sp.]|nr:tetratricopeptide repeat protein [Flavipsychrobacter sp.]
MKQWLFFYCMLLAAYSGAQTDSAVAQAERYWRKAASESLGSPLRQRLLDSALLLEPTNAYYYQQKAMPLFKQQKCEAGMPYLDSAVKYNRERYLPYRAFMKCMFQRSYRDALTDFNAAKRLDSVAYVMDHPYDFYIAICYLQLNNIDAADVYINKCINERRKKFGNNLDHYMHFFYKGIIEMEKENYLKAATIFDTAIKLYPRFSDAKYYKAVCFEKTDDYEQAILLMKEAYDDISNKYTIAEDNVIHERYPYQIKPEWVEANLEPMQEKKK